MRQKVLLRITPGIDPHTYRAINTGTVDVKFGVPLETGQAFAFVQEALLLPGLEVAGPLAGTAAILGHIYPVTLHFHGGKGLACIGGVVLAYSPRTLLFLLGVALLIGVLTRYVAVVTVSMSVIWPLYYGLVTSLWLGAAILAVPALPIFCKHVENFRRMRSVEELRLSFLWNRDAELARVGREDEIGK